MDHVLLCPCCDKMYNLQAREPLVITCCGETACKECFQTKMKKGNNFKCTLCHSTEDVPLIINKMVKKQIEKSFKSKILMVSCDVHNDFLVEYYIKSLNKMVCNKCLFSDHKDHVGEAIHLEGERLESYVKAALLKLESHNAKVIGLINTCKGLVQNDLAIPSNEFMLMADEV